MASQAQLHDAASIPSADLEDWGPVAEPLSEPVSHLRGRTLCSNPDGSEAGLWECSPGTWVRQVMDAEIATFLSGRAIFTPEGGAPLHIGAGDVVWFSANSRGVWQVLETTRKTFLTYKSG